MEIIPDKRKLVGLIEQAYDGNLCLPNFQRDFVWTREEVADLLRSVVRQYFIGSLLLLRTDPQNPPFAPVFLRGARPRVREAKPDLLVLDGQQRLTSLVYALTAPELSLKDSRQRRWFFLDLNLLLEDQENDEIIFDRSPRDVETLNDLKTQWIRRMLPCTRLLRSSDFLKWRDGLDDYLREKEPTEHQRFRETWRDRWTDVVNAFQSFEVPLIELPRVDERDQKSIGRVCAIFEKLNSTGVELSVYDLLTARLYRSGIRLHDLWKEACKENRLLNHWSQGKADTNKFGVLVLRTLALLRNLDPKPRILIDLGPEGFEPDWRRAVAAIDRALEIITNVGPDGFGVFDKKWLPGFGLVPILAALRAHVEDHHLEDGPRADLRRWYWCNVFLERYSSAVESKSRKDFGEFVSFWSGGAEPSVFAEARARIGAGGYTVRDSASFASAVYSGIFCLLALGGARDWKYAESIQLQNLDDHHIFPRKYLHRHGVTKRGDVNTVLNRTLISNQTNKKIRDTAPGVYTRSPEVFPEGQPGELVGSHFIDEQALGSMLGAMEELPDTTVRELYEQFLAARERAIVAAVRTACGVS